MEYPKTHVGGKRGLSIEVTRNTYQVKNINIKVWEGDSVNIVSGGNILLDADNNYYPSEEVYYVVYWNRSMKAELLDKAHWDAHVGMEVDLG